MTVLKFKCTLLSDVVLNQKAAVEGPNKTLDFIPGNCFLGIAASKLYSSLDSQTAWEIFHSGNVIFGDAHPSCDGIRGLKAPLSMYYPKVTGPYDSIYIRHKTTPVILASESLKQLRDGFYKFADGTSSRIETSTNFAVKSAYDRVRRKSKDEQMYSYESLASGLELYFEVVVKNDEMRELISSALTGRRTVGRSRTAQYGLVEIEPYDYTEVKSSSLRSELVEVYADSRLIFLDEYGIPTFRPCAEHFGLDGEIEWDKSQVRTFQYAPWNFKRCAYDVDRCGIEKGSVFVVRLNSSCQIPLESRYVGCYQNEGFGKVIFNPYFLEADDKGHAEFSLSRSTADKSRIASQHSYDSCLLRYLNGKAESEANECTVYSLVNKFIKEGEIKFRSAVFASQWGKIRSIAQKSLSFAELKDSVLEYLGHGVASDKWKERNRIGWLKGVLDSQELADLPDRYARMAIINLSAEMSKKIQEN